MKTPIVITTLEEDFKKIGLIKESVDADDSVEEAKRVKVALRGGKKMRQQRTSAEERRMAKKYRRSAGGKKAARIRARRMKKPSMQRRMKRLAAKATRLGTRQESVETLESYDRSEVLKSFANAAIIAEKLSKFFESYVDSMDIDATIEEQADLLADIAAVCEDVAETLAEMATAIHEGKDGEGFPAIFNESMDFVLDAVDLYESLNEEEEDEDEDESEMSEEAESEEEGSESDEDEDEDEGK